MMSSGSGRIPSAAITSAMHSFVALEALGRPVLERLGGRLLRDPASSAPRTTRAGRCEVSGSPPASEITSGRAVISIRSRIADERITLRARREQPRVALEISRGGMGSPVCRSGTPGSGSLLRLGHADSVAQFAVGCPVGGTRLHYPRGAMDPFLQGCQGLGLALATGMLAGALSGAFGHEGVHRHVIGVLAVVAGGFLFGISLTAADHPAWPGWPAGAVAALGAFGLTEDIVVSAGRRAPMGERRSASSGSSRSRRWCSPASRFLIPPISLVALAASLWLAFGRRRARSAKYEGLRLLR